MGKAIVDVERAMLATTADGLIEQVKERLLHFR